MKRPQYELDFSECDPDALNEYIALESEIENFLADHPGKLTDEEQEYLSSLVRKRPDIMRKLGKVKIKEPKAQL